MDELLFQTMQCFDEMGEVATDFAHTLTAYPNCASIAILCAMVDIYCGAKGLNPIDTWNEMYEMAMIKNANND